MFNSQAELDPDGAQKLIQEYYKLKRGYLSSAVFLVCYHSPDPHTDSSTCRYSICSGLLYCQQTEYSTVNLPEFGSLLDIIRSMPLTNTK